MQLLSIRTGYRGKKQTSNSPTLISTLLTNLSQSCEYSQQMLHSLCGSIRFCVFKHHGSEIFCKCQESSTPEFSQFHVPNQPLRREECEPLTGHFCLPLSITYESISNNSCFAINLTQVKVSESGNRTLVSSQFFCLGVAHPKLALLELVYQMSISQVLSANIENLQIMRHVEDLQEDRKVTTTVKWIRVFMYILLIIVSTYHLMF